MGTQIVKIPQDIYTRPLLLLFTSGLCEWCLLTNWSHKIACLYNIILGTILFHCMERICTSVLSLEWERVYLCFHFSWCRSIACSSLTAMAVVLKIVINLVESVVRRATL